VPSPPEVPTGGATGMEVEVPASAPRAVDFVITWR
jgi:hypothetical protein